MLLLSRERSTLQWKEIQKGKHNLKSGYCSVKNSRLCIKISIVMNLSEAKSLQSLLLIPPTGFR